MSTESDGMKYLEMLGCVTCYLASARVHLKGLSDGPRISIHGTPTDYNDLHRVTPFSQGRSHCLALKSICHLSRHRVG